ncbi:MAG: MarR family winged helix-turn-helix transcriptional regulator [Rubritepida sp.]|nr:MarR family winged helix-turn-helix transcriptional regulator [Rubritepida sp.]
MEPRATSSRFVDDYLLYLLARASHTISGEFHAKLRRAGVPVPVWRVLATLSGGAPETVTGLADACLLQQPTMTKLLDRMVRDELVRRLPDPRDRRVVRIEATAKGEALIKDLLVAAREHERQVVERFPVIEAQDLKKLLRAMMEKPARGRRAAAPAPG